MHRRDFMGGVCASLATSSVFAQPADPAPLDIGTGPQLFLDDYLIDRLDGLIRRVQTPRRHGPPVLDSKTFGTSQPYLTVLPQDGGKGYRIWYNHGGAIWHAESADGIRWTNPREAWNFGHGYGASMVDDGARAMPPTRRFKLANWQTAAGRQNAGMHVAFSPDGLLWTPHDRNPVLPMYPEGPGVNSRHGVSDIVDVYFDPLTRRYRAAVKLHAQASDGYKPAPRAGNIFRRLVGMTSSADFLHWDRPWRIHTPDNRDDGLLEFYGMGGMHVRGKLHIGLVRVLRDDLPCDPGGPPNGIGYAVLATSRDGVHWTRYREPFLDRNLEKGSWDHAMTWMGGALPVGDEVFFYYGGYARGHKIAAATERQIGLARMKRDRYVALAPSKERGVLQTKPFVVPNGRLTVNVKSDSGAIRIRLLNAAGQPLDTLGTPDAEPISGDVLAAEARWRKPLAGVRGRPVRLEIEVRRGELFGLEFQ